MKPSTHHQHSAAEHLLAGLALALASLLPTLVMAAEPAAAQGEVPRPVGSDQQVLARVDLVGSASDLGVPVFAAYRDAGGRDYAIVMAPASALSALGLETTVVDAPASPGSYLVARVRTDDARRLLPATVELLHDDGLNLLLRATPAHSDTLAEAGLDIAWLPLEPIVWTPRDAVPAPKAIVYTPQIAALMNQVESSAVSDWNAGLSGETQVMVEGAPYTITSRHTSSGTPIQKATLYVYERFAAWGLNPSFHSWVSGSRSGRNVIGELVGSRRPTEIVLVCGHLDDMPSTGAAPGADDNASGSVGVLVAAQILLQQPWERTVRFALFTGEEQGLLGSAAYAAMVKARGDNIVAVLNMDMIAWNTLSSSPTARLHTRVGAAGAADLVIGQTLSDVVTTYGLGSALQPIIDPDGITASDHASFWNQGYPALLAIEDDASDFNPWYHTVNDRLSALNLPYFTAFVQASLGTTAHLAVYDDLIFMDGFQ